MSTQPYYYQGTVSTAARALASNHSRVVGRALASNHSRVVGRALASNHSRVVAAAGRA
jgi:hypothetical protein